MGYIGFGMRKEVYTRKPKTSFSKMKKIYGDHLEDFHKSKEVRNRWSDKDKEAFKAYVTKKIKNDNIAERALNLIVYAGIVAIVGMAIYFAWG
jgi:DNA-directed RNA polymerase alpha subunit